MSVKIRGASEKLRQQQYSAVKGADKRWGVRRKTSGKKPGGQSGHDGSTLGLNDAVDNIADEKPDTATNALTGHESHRPCISPWYSTGKAARDKNMKTVLETRWNK